MELQEFITESLVQIVQAVQDAQKKVADTGAKINPQMKNIFPSGEQTHPAFGWSADPTPNPVMLIDFDVAVTAETGKQTKGGIGIAGVFALGSQGASDTTNASISRIRLCVPLLLPTHQEYSRFA
jgi:tryptophan synthase beta subunit